MKRRFIYFDDKSSKFWSIEINGSELTVNYGKTGTGGQMQAKSFVSDEECQKAADKLIKEKTGKGYVEEGAVGSPVKALNDDTYKSLTEIIDPRQADGEYNTGDLVQYPFVDMAEEDDGQEMRIVKGNLHVSGIESTKLQDWNLYNLIIDGDLIVDGDIDWAESGNGSLILVTGNLKARNVIIWGNAELVVLGNMDVNTILCFEGDDGGVLTVKGDVRAGFIICTTYFNVNLENRPQGILIADDEDIFGYEADYVYFEDEDDKDDPRHYNKIFAKAYLDEDGLIDERKLRKALITDKPFTKKGTKAKPA